MRREVTGSLAILVRGTVLDMDSLPLDHGYPLREALRLIFVCVVRHHHMGIAELELWFGPRLAAPPVIGPGGWVHTGERVEITLQRLYPAWALSSEARTRHASELVGRRRRRVLPPGEVV